MSPRPKAGAVLYARDLGRVQAFYREVIGFEVSHVESDHVVLDSPGFQLVVLQIPPAIAESIEMARPPKRRTDTAIKLVFPVNDIAAARTAAGLHGGELNPAEREWTFQGCCVCDGCDPEGNVLQVRQQTH